MTVFCISNLASQLAPDFTVTDFNQKTHKLYADYLDKDKVVVIKFFFVGCPPCASVAPYVQSAYTRAGSGSGNVEFFQITTLSSDKNATVKSYHQSKGLTFPGIGSDGNSAQALAPYKSGTFGTWYGTPTFVVIAPNGEVDYNVNMSAGNPYGLDTAIARAFRKVNNGGGGGGGMECEDSFTVKTITQLQPDGYYIVDYQGGNPTQTLDSGLYYCQFPLPQNLDEVFVLPYINKKDSSLNGITTGDIVRIQRHILGLEALNNLQLRCADVNNSGSVTAADVSEIRKLVLGVTSKFSRLTESFAIAHNPKSKNYWDYDNKVLVRDLINKTKTNEFGVCKFGDVSGALLLKEDIFENRAQRIQSATVSEEMISPLLWSYTIALRDFNQLEAFQFGLKFPVDELVQLELCDALSNWSYDYAIDRRNSYFKVSAISDLKENSNPATYVLKLKTRSKVNLKELEAQEFLPEFIYKSGATANDFKLQYEDSPSRLVLVYQQYSTNSLIIESTGSLSRLELFDLNGRVLYSAALDSLTRVHVVSEIDQIMPKGPGFIRIYDETGKMECKSFVRI